MRRRDHAAIFEEYRPVADPAGKIGVLHGAAARNVHITIRIRPQVGELSAAVHDCAVAARHGQTIQFVAAADHAGLISAVIHVVLAVHAAYGSAFGDVDDAVPRIICDIRRTAALDIENSSVVHDQVVRHAAFKDDRAVAGRNRPSTDVVALPKETGFFSAVVNTGIPVKIGHIGIIVRDDGSAPGIVFHRGGRSARNKSRSGRVDIKTLRHAAVLNNERTTGQDVQVGRYALAVDNHTVARCHGEVLKGIGLQNETGFLPAVVNTCITFKIRHGRAFFGYDRAAPRRIKHIRRAAVLNGQDAAVIHIHAVHHAAFVHDRAVAARDIQRTKRIRFADYADAGTAVIHVRFPAEISDRRIAVRRNAALPRIEHDAGAAIPVHFKTSAGIHRDAIECTAGGPGISAGLNDGISCHAAIQNAQFAQHFRIPGLSSGTDIQTGEGFDKRIGGGLAEIQIRIDPTSPGATISHGSARQDKPAHRLICRIFGNQDVVHICPGHERHVLENGSAGKLKSGAGGKNKPLHHSAVLNRKRTARLNGNIGGYLSGINRRIRRGNDSSGNHEVVQRIRGNRIRQGDVVDSGPRFKANMSCMRINRITEITAGRHRNVIHVRSAVDG